MVKDAREIPRAPLVHTDTVEAELRGDVLERARTAFGYRADSFGASGPLSKALQRLDIAPLDTAAVQQYMAGKVREWRTHRKALAHGALTIGLPGLLFGAFTLLVRTGFLGFTAAAGPTTASSAVLFVVSAIVSLASIVYGNLFASDVVYDFEHKLSWTRFTLGMLSTTPLERERLGNLKSYERYVPVHVLNLALQLHDAVPSVHLYVDELQHTFQRVPRPLPDPFLSVELGAEKYYIAVWDEREFEARA